MARFAASTQACFPTTARSGIGHPRGRRYGVTSAARSWRESFAATRASRCGASRTPRTTLTLEGWLDALPHLEMVGTVRHPLAVARSLRGRPRGPELPEGLRLWTAYNARLWKWYCRRGFPIVSFDASADQLAAALREVTRRLDLPGESLEAAPFFDPELRHQIDPAEDEEKEDVTLLTDETRQLYERLTMATKTWM